MARTSLPAALRLCIALLVRLSIASAALAVPAALAQVSNGLKDVTPSTVPGNFIPGFTLTTSTTVGTDDPAGIYLQSSDPAHVGQFTVSANGTTLGSFDLTAIAFAKFSTAGSFTFAVTGYKLGGGTVTTGFTTVGGSTSYSAGNYASFTGLTGFNIAIQSNDGIHGAEENTFDSFTIANATAPAATIASATYHAGTGVLAVTASNLIPGDTIDVSRLTLTGEGGATYTLTTANVTAASSTAFSVTLSATDRAAVNPILNRNGTISTGGTTYNLAAAAGWNVSQSSPADLTSPLTISNVAVPAITSATYHAGTGVLTVTGTGFLKLAGADNDIDVSKLTLTGEGGNTYTLTTTPGVEIASGTSFSVTLSAPDRAAVNPILNKNGTSSTSGTTYHLAAAEDWAAGADAAVNVADISGNPVTVSNVPAPAITSATYDAVTGVLTVTGTGFLQLAGANNDIDVSKLTVIGEGGSTYTFANTPNVEITSSTAFSVTLSATDRTAVNLLLNRNGTSSAGGTTYNLIAAEDWAAGADAAVNVADFTGNSITVTGINTAPVDITLSNASVAQSGGTNATVGTLSTIDPDAGDTFTYTLISGTGSTHNAFFNILGATLRANDASALSAGSRSVRIRTTDAGGATFEKAFTITVVDDIAPSVTSVSVPANGTYIAGQNLDFTLNFSETVTVNTAGGTPRLSLSLDTGGTVYASYVSGSGTSALVFRYTVMAGHADPNGITVGTLGLNGGTIRDAAGNNASLTLNNVGSTAGVLVDAIAPAVASVSVPANGTYIAGQTLDFTVSFTKSVIVNTAGGTPRLSLSLDTGGTVYASYVSGSGTSALVFRYTVIAGHADPNGITIGALAFNGGTIRDAVGNDASLALNNVGSTTGVLIDAIAPAVSAIDRHAPVGELTNATSVVFRISFTEAVSGVDSTDFTLTTTATAAGAIGSVTAVSALLYEVTVGSLTGDGTVRLDLKPTGTGISDAAGNAIAGGFSTGQAYTLDHTPPAAPVISGISTDTGASNTDGVTSDQTLVVNGTAEAGTTISLSLGGVDVLGTTTASGAGNWSFTLGSALAEGAYVFTATATDAAGNTSSASAGFAVTIDVTAPVITSAATANGTYGLPFTYTLTASGSPTAFSATGLPAWLSLNPTTGEITGTPTQTGGFNVTLTATDLAGNSSDAPLAVTIARASALIGFGNLTRTYDGSPHAATVTTTPAGLTVSVTYNGSAAAPRTAGSYAVAATITDPNHSGTGSATLTIARAPQTITFAAPATAMPDTPVVLEATASSGLPVTFSLLSGDGTLAGSSLRVASSSVVVRATQAGNENYLPATAEQTIALAGKLAQTIAFAPIADRPATAPAFALSATASSGLPVTFTLDSGPAALSGHTLALTGAPGTIVVRASQPGSAAYHSAPDVTQAFDVIAAGRSIYFGVTSSHDPIAVDLAPDGRSGTLLCYLAATRQAFIVGFTVAHDSTFLATVTPLGNATVASDPAAFSGEGGWTAATELAGTPVIVAAADAVFSPPGASPERAGTMLTFRGQLGGDTVSGSIVEMGLSFSAKLRPGAGATEAIAGYYRSTALNAADGGTASIISAQGEVLFIATTAAITTGATGMVAADGSFTVQAPGATITGAVHAPTTTLAGQIVVPNQPPVSFAGLAGSTARTDRLVNVSSRVRVGPAAGRMLITGFVIGGAEAKRVLLRAVGPALAGFGVSGALANPRLEVYDSAGTRILANDDWSGSDTAAAFAQVGAFALAPGARDAALLAVLTPGAYTMHVPDDGQSGIALAEIYDASAHPGSEYQRLINISSLGMVESGDGVLIGGFVITGNAPKKVLVRGVGPGLTAFGVAGALADPRLAIHGGQTLVAQNDDWATPLAVGANQGVATAAELAAAARAAGAFALPAGSKDAAVIVTLAPGAYTAQVTSTDGSTGIALVEIYELEP